MSWFRRKPRLDEDAIARLHDLERKLKVIEADWDEWYDKFRRLYARLSKRVERDEKASTLPQDERSEPERHRTTNPLALALLTGRHDGLLPDR